jgi:prophage regulatory protein
MECDFAGVTEVGHILGVSRQRAAQLAESPGVPAPVAELASGRIWRAQDIRLWSETPRRQGRPRSDFRIEYAGDRDERRRGRHIVAVRMVSIQGPRRRDETLRRWIGRHLVGFANQQLSAQRPTNQAHLSVRHALVNLCGLQLRHEIEDAYPLVNKVPMEAELDHTWRKYLLSSAESVRHPIGELQIGTALPLESDHLTQLRGRNSAPLSQVQMDCGHWAERALFPRHLAAYDSEGVCPKCGNLRTIVRLWPER